MVRAITFDAFGTLIDTGRDVLIRIARSVCDDQRPSLDAERLLATWDRHFFAAETAPFLTLAEITEDSLAKTFREYSIDASPAPYVDRLVALWREAKAYAEVPRAAIQRIEDTRDFGVRLRLPPQGDEAIDVRPGGRLDSVLAKRLLEAVFRDLRQREERGGLRREEVTVPRREEGLRVEARPLILT